MRTDAVACRHSRDLSVFVVGLLTLLLALPLTLAVNADEAEASSVGDSLASMAESQIGYRGEVGGGMNGNYQRHDNTKYGKFTGANPAFWCASFVAWCANQVGVPTSLIPKTAGTKDMAEGSSSYRAMNSSNFEGLARGDVIFFSKVASLTYSNGKKAVHHVGIVTAVNKSAKAITMVEGNTERDYVKKNTYYIDPSNGKITKGYSGTEYLCGYISVGGGTPGNHNPIGHIDSIKDAGNGLVSVGGWAYDPDVPNEPIEVHVYIGGEAGKVPGYPLVANVARPDVNKVLSIGGNHGFQSGCGTDRSGNVPVYIYAINKGAGETVLLGSQTINISKDKVKPTISNVKVSNITTTGYRVSCTVKDNVGVSKVEFPTWTHANGQSDDIIWHKGIKSGDNYYYDVKVSEHKGETGFYSTHIYAFDAAGNEASSGVPSNIFVPLATASYGNSVFYISDAHYSWKEAQETCANAYGSGHLATIGSAEEQSAIRGLLKNGSSTYYYIGASDASSEGSWKWLDDEDLGAYSNWASGEPNGGTNENYGAILKSNGKWNDLNGKSRTDTGLIMEVDLKRDIAGEVLTDFPEGTYSITSFKNTDYSIDIEAASTKECANVQIYKANGTDAQKFKFTKNDDDTYTITNVKSGMVLDVEAGSWKDLTNVWQYSKNGTAAQKWYVEKGDGDFYYLRCKKNNLYLDIYGGTMANGTNVDAYHANYTAAQKFVLVKVDKPKVIASSVTDITPDGYTVNATLDTMEGWERIEVPTWTHAGDKDGQDDITWDKGTLDGNTLTYRVKTSAHNGERGLYSSHLWIFDKYGNSKWLAEFNDILVPTAVESAGSSTYYVVDQPASWADAQKLGAKQAFVKGHESHLVSIDSAEEQAVVAKLAKQGKQTYYFIGASDADAEGSWKWTTGDAVSGYTNWASGEPNGGSKENYGAIIRSTGLWNDLAGAQRSDAGFILEVEGDDRVGPEVKDISLDSLDDTGYTVSCVVSDYSGIDKVRFASWPESGNEADAVWADATTDGLSDAQIYDDGSVCLRVHTDELDGTAGAYRTKVYATDKAGNESVVDISESVDLLVPDATYASDGSLYYRFDAPMSWTAARDYLASLGIENLRLASITDEADRDSLVPLMAGASKTAYWIGLADEAGDGTYAWADGGDYASGSANWASGQPAKSGSASYAALFTSNQKWYALAEAGVGTNSSEMGFIAEITLEGEDDIPAELCDGEHTWGEWSVGKEATCTQAGYRERVCEVCGDVEVEEIEALGHDAAEPVHENEIDATCTTEGSYDLVTYCSRCNEVLASEKATTPVVDHAWTDWTAVESATCEEGGLARRVCSFDDSHVEERAVDALGHDAAEPVVENEVPATCEADGSYESVVYCGRCGEELSRETVVIPATGHDWGEWTAVAEATCDEPGLERRVCATDASHMEERAVEALGHSYIATTIAPTEESDGYTVYVCSICGDAYVGDRVDSLGRAKDRAAADAVQVKIDSLPASNDLTLADEGLVADARAAYGALTDAQKALVSHVEAIDAAERRLVELADEQKAAADRAAADAAIAAIKAIPSVTGLEADDAEGIAAAKAAIAEAHKAYDVLTGDQLALVTNANRLFAAEQVVAGLEEQAADDIESVSKVDALIAAVSTRGLEVGDVDGIATARKAVDKARAAYDKLTAAQKALVQDAEGLYTAEVAVADLERRTKEAADKAAADTAVQAISALPSTDDLALSDSDAVATARAAYEALGADQRRYVENYDTLVVAEQRIAQLAREFSGTEEDQAAALPVADAIASLPSSKSITASDVDSVAAARAAYDALTPERKDLVDEDKLLIAESRLVDAQKAEFESALEGAALGGASKVLRNGKATVKLPAAVAKLGAWSWATSDPAVAVVDATGAVRGLKAGSVTVTATCAYPLYGGTQLTRTLERAVKVYTISLSGAKVSGIAAKTYTGKALTQSPTVKADSKTLKLNTDYTLSYKNNVKVGTATLVITGKGNYAGSVSKTFKIDKAANTLVTKGSTKTVKFKKLKKAKQAVKKAVSVSKAAGAVSYKKKSGNKQITVNAKNGTITVAKGLKKGSYKVKVAVSAKGNANYKAATKTVTVTIKVK